MQDLEDIKKHLEETKILEDKIAIFRSDKKRLTKQMETKRNNMQKLIHVIEGLFCDNQKEIDQEEVINAIIVEELKKENELLKLKNTELEEKLKTFLN